MFCFPSSDQSDLVENFRPHCGQLSAAIATGYASAFVVHAATAAWNLLKSYEPSLISDESEIGTPPLDQEQLRLHF